MFNTIVQDLKTLIASNSILKQSEKLNELISEFNKLKNEARTEVDVNQLLANDLINELKRKLFEEK